jgi:hypothetical protein
VTIFISYKRIAQRGDEKLFIEVAPVGSQSVCAHFLINIFFLQHKKSFELMTILSGNDTFNNYYEVHASVVGRKRDEISSLCSQINYVAAVKRETKCCIKEVIQDA